MSELAVVNNRKGAPCDFLPEYEAEIESGEIPIPMQEAMTQATVDMILHRVAEIEAEIHDNDKSADTQIERIQLWKEAVNQRLLNRRAFYEKPLEDWMRTNGHKTKQLVNGTLKLRKQQPQIEILDEQKVLSDGRFVRLIPQKMTVDKSALRTHVKTTGELVEGVSVTIPEDKFSFHISESYR